MADRRRWTRYAAAAAQALLAVIALTIAFRTLQKQWSGSSAVIGRLRPDWLWISLSGILFLATYAVLIETWREVLRVWRTHLSFANAARIWSVSNLYRYVPGKLWQIGAMGVMAQRAKANPIPATGSAILNVAVNLIAGFFVGAAFGWPLLERQASDQAPLNLAVEAARSDAGPNDQPNCCQFSDSSFRVPPVSGHPALSAPCVFRICNSISWLMYGVAFAAFSRGIIGSSQGSLGGYIAVYAISYLVGYLFLFAPAGVGFREASMIALLPAARLADPTQAAILAVTSRLWLTALEIAPGALFLGFDGLRRPRED